MIRLYQFARAFNAANASPFCIKMETLLRMADLPYEIVLTNNPSKAPTQKCPYIEIDGKIIGDSGVIQQFLEDEKGVVFGRALTEAEMPLSLGLTRLAEEHLYWALIQSRWVDDAGWMLVKQTFFSKLPPVISWILPNILRKQVIKASKAHGLGRHSASTIYQMANEDLQAISGALGDKAFIFGDEPTATDAAIYGQLSSILDADHASPLKIAAMEYPNLKTYTARMRARYFADL